MKTLFTLIASLLIATSVYAEPRMLEWDRLDNPNCTGYIIEVSGDLGSTWAEVGRTTSIDIVTMEVDVPTDKMYLYRASAIYPDGIMPNYVCGVWFDATKDQKSPSGVSMR